MLSSVGDMIEAISEAWSEIGNRNVPFGSSASSVNEVTSTLFSLRFASAASTPDLIAGKTTADWPTMFSQSGDAANFTHCQAASWFFEPTQIESARPLNMVLRPADPFGSGAKPTENLGFVR